MAPAKTTLEVDVGKLNEAAVQAGFQQGRCVRVSIEYVDAGDARKVTARRLRPALDKLPIPAETSGMTDAEIIEYAVRLTDEARGAHRKRQNDTHSC
ncbi:MAG: hypothetical protein PW843_25320 [Azospirillaceae bacterium]|nr:hypothetical protein [Azospirillaceae bacterium]